jgi:signal transduction histidine kinase
MFFFGSSLQYYGMTLYADISHLLMLNELATSVSNFTLAISDIDRNKYKALYKYMRENKFILVSELEISSQHQGFIFLGSKNNNEAFTTEDVLLIEDIVLTYTSAVGRSLLHLATEQFNQILKQKVDLATKEIQGQKEQIEDAYKAERDRMNILSHELRTPLGTARNSVSLLKMLYEKGDLNQGNPKVPGIIDRALENLRREVVLLERIFTVSQIRAGTITAKKEEVNCNEVVDKAVKAFRHLADSKNIETIIKLPEIPILISSDKAKVEEIVENIYENATKYTNEGKIMIALEDLGDKVKFTISDTGIGIPKDEIPKLGEQEYYKVDTYLKSVATEGVTSKMPLMRPDGTGMGMFVIRNLCKLLGAELFIQSEEDKGSVFSVVFKK